MNERKMRSLKLRVIRLFANWKDPHEDMTYNESDIIQEIEITSEGINELLSLPSTLIAPAVY